MVVRESAWSFRSEEPLTQWYGHVQLLPDRVLGQWACLDRESGEKLWQRSIFRANTACAVDSCIIVASETRSDGPWTADFGCYGISLADGRLLWTSHRTGIWGHLTRLLDFVPMFTNDLRDTPHHVIGGRVYCDSGRVLDVKTGRTAGKVSRQEVESFGRPASPAERLYRAGKDESVDTESGVSLARCPDGWGVLGHRAGREVWRLQADDQGAVLGRHFRANYYAYRLAEPYLYLVLSDEPAFKPHPTKAAYVEPNPTTWHLVTLDVATGSVVQDLALGAEPMEACRIEDVDERALLIGQSGPRRGTHGDTYEVSYFPRRL